MATNVDRHIDRALLLYDQSRYDEALREIATLLDRDPDNPVGHVVSALCLSGKGAHRAAEQSARRAIAAAPDFAFAHYGLARILLNANRTREAEAPAREAVRLAPNDADFYAVLAATLAERKRWKESLEVAEQGLRIEAGNTLCINVRATALTQMGQNDAAAAAIRSALAINPDNALTHTNMGATLLRDGRVEEALPYFREALRLDPTLDIARTGVLEALRARNPIYRAVLRCTIWMNTLNDRAQWFLIFGAYFAYRILRIVAMEYPATKPFVIPMLALYALFVVLSWTARPFANLLLRMDPVGRMLLNRGQITASNILGVCTLVGLGALVGYLVFGSFELLLLTIIGLGLVIPVAGTYGDGSRPPSRLMLALCGVLLLLGAGSLIACFIIDQNTSLQLIALFAIGAVLSNFVAVGVSAVRR